jgi:hypothetical protein
MKSIITILVLIISSFSAYAQKDVSPQIVNALGKGDAVTLATFFNENVELIVGSTNDVFSKKQATGIVADFFRRNKVTAFQVLHKGNKDNSAFSICTMKTATNTFRVYILVRHTANQQLIQQLRIEPSNEQ